MLSERVTLLWIANEMAVLILVIVEDALWEKYDVDYLDIVRCVLILVIVEDALWEQKL